MGGSVIQWNSYGFRANFAELQCMVADFNLFAFILQETHLELNNPVF